MSIAFLQIRKNPSKDLQMHRVPLSKTKTQKDPALSEAHITIRKFVIMHETSLHMADVCVLAHTRTHTHTDEKRSKKRVASIGLGNVVSRPQTHPATSRRCHPHGRGWPPANPRAPPLLFIFVFDGSSRPFRGVFGWAAGRAVRGWMRVRRGGFVGRTSVEWIRVWMGRILSN